MLNEKPEMPAFIKDVSPLHDLPAESDQATKRPSDQASHVESLCEGARYVIGHKSPGPHPHCGPLFVCDPEDMKGPDPFDRAPTLTRETKVGDGGMPFSTKVKIESDTRQGSPLGLEALRSAFRVPPNPDFLRQDFSNVEDAFVKFKDPFPKHTKQIEAAGGKVLCSLRMAQEQMLYALRNQTMIRRMVEVMSHLKDGDQSTLPLGIIFALFPFGMSYILVTQEDV